MWYAKDAVANVTNSPNAKIGVYPVAGLGDKALATAAKNGSDRVKAIANAAIARRTQTTASAPVAEQKAPETLANAGVSTNKESLPVQKPGESGTETSKPPDAKAAPATTPDSAPLNEGRGVSGASKTDSPSVKPVTAPSQGAASPPATPQAPAKPAKVSLNDIPPGYLLSTQVETRAYNEETGKFEMRTVSAQDAIEATRKDIETLSALKRCLAA